MTLADFLLARITEDEAAAREASTGYAGRRHWLADKGSLAIGDRTGGVVAYEVDFAPARTHIARHDPARVLAECETKRRIVEEYVLACSATYTGSETPAAAILEPVARLLALPYADHPDHQQEWAL